MPDDQHNSSTPLTTSEVQQLIASDYALSPTRVRLIAHGINDTYAVEADEARFAFRIYGRDKSWIRTTSDLRYELDLLAVLTGDVDQPGQGRLVPAG